MNHDDNSRGGQAIARAMAITTMVLAPAVGAAADTAGEGPADMVGALHSAFGQHHVRAVHAKGIILEGRFTPTPEAAGLTRAGVFAAGTIAVTARFSDFTGLPDIPDTVGDASPRGFALKAWPEGRQLVKLGTVTLTRIEPEQAKTDKALLFLPGRLPPGIEIADPMVAMRNAAYPISFGERQ
jgi:catalase